MAWLLFKPGETRTSNIRRGAEPVPGKNVPVGTIAKSVNDDLLAKNHPADFELQQNGTVLLNPYLPAPAAPDPSTPDLEAFTTALWADPGLKPARLQLLGWKPLLLEYLSRPGGDVQIKEAWADIKVGLGAQLSAKVEAHAQAAKIPLI